MKEKTKYTNNPIEFKIIDDFLPSPDKLVLKKRECQSNDHFE